jgi:hypothetical protein
VSSFRANASSPRGHAYACVVAAFCAAMVLSGCSDSKVLTLGTPKPKVVPPGAELLTDLIPANVKNGTATDNNISNATLTGDMLEVFFSSNKDVWTARRASAALPFEPPVSLNAINTSFRETSPAISADGLTLWFATDRANFDQNLDIWKSTRPSRAGDWSAPVDCPNLDSTGDDLPRPPGNHGLVLPLSVARNDGLGRMHQIFFASRPRLDVDFGMPVPALELPHPPAGSATDPFLSDDGLLLFYSNQPANNAGDIVLAEHGAWGQPFGSDESMDGVNTADWKEGDPWLSPDGKTLYYTSHRAVNLDAGAVDDSGPVTNQDSHVDRIYRVEFDATWMP